jgi:hypothetical protein
MGLAWYRFGDTVQLKTGRDTFGKACFDTCGHVKQNVFVTFAVRKKSVHCRYENHWNQRGRLEAIYVSGIAASYGVSASYFDQVRL